MEQNKPKFRLKLNLFDGIVLVLALAAAAFLLWRAIKPAAPAQTDPEAPPSAATVRYTVRFQRWAQGTSGAIQPEDQLIDNVKNYEMGKVVSVQAEPARMQVLDQENRRWVWAELEDFEDILVTIEAPCTINDEKTIYVDGAFAIRAGTICYFRGSGYMGSGPIVSVEEVRG